MVPFETVGLQGRMGEPELNRHRCCGATRFHEIFHCFVFILRYDSLW